MATVVIRPPSTTAPPPAAEPEGVGGSGEGTDGGEGASSRDVPVRVGADVLAAQGFAPLVGRRVGLITNASARIDDRPVLQALLDSPVDVVAVFAPEHGIEGLLPAGQLFEDGETAEGMQVFSLYGSRRAPTVAQLAGVDVVVFDLQDVGVRAYTYLATMGMAMEAAAAAGVDFVVLDRPNPIGGELVSGHVRTPDQESFISQYPVTGVHGMTAGEMALAIKGEGWRSGVADLTLDVVPVEGWQRTERWNDTGLVWHPPSPNLPSPESALIYPGLVLFEATQLSVGRGTAAPFTTVGGGWVDGVALAAAINDAGVAGVELAPTEFTPTSGAAAPNPPWENTTITGVQITVTDEAAFRPIELAMHLLVALDAQANANGTELIDRPAVFDLLAGTGALRAALDSGAGVDALVAAWEGDVATFRQLREPYLLYD